MEKIEASGTVDLTSHGEKFLRLDAEVPLIKYESFGFYAEKRIIKALGLEPGQKVKITIEKIS